MQYDHQTAGALLVRQDGKLLLGLRSATKRVAPGMWDIVGGGIEPGETVEQALDRELVEELGVRPTVVTLLATIPDALSIAPLTVLHHVFAVSAWSGGDPVNAGDEHTELRWFDIDELDGLANKTPFDFGALCGAALKATARASAPGSRQSQAVTGCEISSVEDGIERLHAAGRVRAPHSRREAVDDVCRQRQVTKGV